MSDYSTDHLIDYLVDVYSIEQQALAQLRKAPDIAGAPGLAQHLKEHLLETEAQAKMIGDRLEAVGGSPSTMQDAVMKVGGKGFLAFAMSQPDTPGKLAAHAHSYEALEAAAYELLVTMAGIAGDGKTVEIAQTILEQEQTMKRRLADDLEEAARASLHATRSSAGEALPAYLADAHALEKQAIELLKKAPESADDELADLYRRHLRESEKHARMIEQRLQASGKKPSKVKDSALAAAGLNWSFFFKALDDTAAKLAAFVYAFEHLEIAGYELLRHVAREAGDSATVDLATEILEEERVAAEAVYVQLGETLRRSVAA